MKGLSFLFIGGPLVTKSWTNTTKDRLVAYMVCGKYSHNLYGFRYTICEVFNFCNAVRIFFVTKTLLSITIFFV